MKMITKEIEKKMARYPLYSQDGKGDEAVVLFKAFNPYGCQSWYVLEAGEEIDGDRELFVWAYNGYEGEYGYMMLSDLATTLVNFHGVKLPLERDKWFSGTIADAKRDCGIAGKEVI